MGNLPEIKSILSYLNTKIAYKMITSSTAKFGTFFLTICIINYNIDASDSLVGTAIISLRVIINVVIIPYVTDC